MGKQSVEECREQAELQRLLDGVDESHMQVDQKDTALSSVCPSANLNVQLNVYVQMSKPAASHCLIQRQIAHLTGGVYVE